MDKQVIKLSYNLIKFKDNNNIIIIIHINSNIIIIQHSKLKQSTGIMQEVVTIQIIK